MVDSSDLGDINIIGFSFTGYGGETSFGALLANTLTSRGWSGVVREVSYGGLSVNALAGLIGNATERIAYGDVVGLEIATSFYSQHGYKVENAIPYVFHITRRLLAEKGRKLFFLNLFRRDLDDQDCVVQAIRAVAAYFGVPILDLKASFRTGADQGYSDATDGVHPSLTGRQRIADHLMDFLSCTNFGSLGHSDFVAPSFHFVPAFPGGDTPETLEYNERGKAISGVVVPAGKSFTWQLAAGDELEGLCFLYGPETGFVEIVDESSSRIELITYDEHSYYRRVGFRPVALKGRTITVHSLVKTRNIELVRASRLDVRGRCDFVCGLIVKRNGDTVSTLFELAKSWV